MAEAYLMLYPSAFPETSGISTMESLYYNTPLVTCYNGALEETAINGCCFKMPYAIDKDFRTEGWMNEEEQVNKFVNLVMSAWNNPYLVQQKMYACNFMKKTATWDTIALQWKQHFYAAIGEFLPVDEHRAVSRINTRVREAYGRRFTNPEERIYYKSDEQHRIAVITPVWNAEKYIDKCIKSVAAQDYYNWNMIIIDDDSEDDTVDIAVNTVKSLPKYIQERIIIIKNYKNVGAVQNQVEAIRELDRKSTRLNSSHSQQSRMPSSA